MRRAAAPGATAEACLAAIMLRGAAKGALAEALALLVAAPMATRAEVEAEVMAAISKCLRDEAEQCLSGYTNTTNVAITLIGNADAPPKNILSLPMWC